MNQTVKFARNRAGNDPERTNNHGGIYYGLNAGMRNCFSYGNYIFANRWAAYRVRVKH
jgi:hypothetical protein